MGNSKTQHQNVLTQNRVIKNTIIHQPKLVISFIILLTIIIYLLIDNLHNKDDKWEVALFIRFSKVIVYENYIYIYIYIL